MKLQKYGDPADLDAAQGDPRWGQGTMDTNRDGDLNWNGVALQASAAAAKVMWVSKSDDQTCVSNSGFAREPVLLSQLKQNGRLCVLTTEGRVALVVVTQASEASVSLKVTTYKKDGD